MRKSHRSSKRFYIYFSILLFIVLGTFIFSFVNGADLGGAAILPLVFLGFGTVVYFGMFHGLLPTINSMNSKDPRERQKSYASLAGIGNSLNAMAGKNAGAEVKYSPHQVASVLDPHREPEKTEDLRK